MYFWKIEKLKDEIKTNNLKEKDRFIYAFIYIALSTIVMETLVFIPVEELNFWDKVSSVGNILIPLAGTFFAYKANGGANGVDFLGRFFSISFVVAIRFLLFLFPIVIVFVSLYMFMLPGERDVGSTPVESTFFFIWSALLYVRICKHISDVKDA